MIFKNLLRYLGDKWEETDVCSEIPITSVNYSVPGFNVPPKSFFDAQARYIWLPGLYDSHIHGAGGHDFSEGTYQAFETITQTLGENGVAFCAATFVSMPLAQLKICLAALNQFIQAPQKPGAAKIVAVHLEGPFIAKECKGAHDEQTLQTQISLELFLDIISAAPQVTHWKMTIAPELPGSMEFIEHTRNLVVKDIPITVEVFIGHSNASEATVRKAIEKGARGFTHLGNANKEKGHHSDQPINVNDLQSSVVRSALSHQAPVELIVDGQHLAPTFIKLVHQYLPSHLLLISDALSPTRMPDGEYPLGSLTVLKQGERIVLKENPSTLAGSASLLPNAVKELCRILSGGEAEDLAVWTTLYHALVSNPRAHHAAYDWSDENNYVILDRLSGELVLSSCHGKVSQHTPFVVVSNTPNGRSIFTSAQPNEQNPAASTMLRF